MLFNKQTAIYILMLKLLFNLKYMNYLVIIYKTILLKCVLK